MTGESSEGRSCGIHEMLISRGESVRGRGREIERREINESIWFGWRVRTGCRVEWVRGWRGDGDGWERVSSVGRCGLEERLNG